MSRCEPSASDRVGLPGEHVKAWARHRDAKYVPRRVTRFERVARQCTGRTLVLVSFPLVTVE